MAARLGQPLLKELSGGAHLTTFTHISLVKSVVTYLKEGLKCDFPVGEYVADYNELSFS